jgi:hypothetical protein
MSKWFKSHKLYDGKLKRNTDIREGFVITAVNRRAVYTVKSFVEDLEAQQGGIMLEGKYAGDPFSIIMPLVCKKKAT